MRHRLSWQAFVALVVGCSSSSSGPTADQACTDQAKARCQKTQECSVYQYQTRYGADDATCERIEKQFCMNAFAAPSTGKTVAKVESCVAASSNQSCADWLANNAPTECLAAPGTLGNAAPCAFGGQCTSGYCSIPANFGCGKCAPATKVGDSCASSLGCSSETTGQYCALTPLTCTLPVQQGGTCDNSSALCVSGLNCAGLTMTSNGTCQPPVTTLGADCTPTNLPGGVGCDRQHGLVCDAPSKKCVAVAFPTAGQPCGVVNNVLAFCADSGFCQIPNGKNAGTCIAAAADGAACDIVNGPGCAYRSSCVVSVGSTGVCTPIGGVACK